MRVVSRRGSRAAFVAAVCGGLLLTACSGGSEPRIQPAPTSTTLTPTSSPSVSPAVDPAAQPALDAYEAFWRAAKDAERDPAAFSKDEESAKAFTSVAFDPIRIQYIDYIAGLANEKTAFRGTPGRPRVKVQSVDLAAQPYPLIVLTDCMTPAPTWRKYVVKTGELVPDANGSVSPPYKLTVEVIKVDGRWGPSKVTADKSRTCTAA